MKELHERIGAVIGSDIAKEQLQAVSATYKEIANRIAKDKPERKTALYNLKKSEDAIKAIDVVRSALDRDLSSIATSPESMVIIQDAISHNTDLFYNIIKLDYDDQVRITNLIKKIKRDKLKKVA